MTSYNQPNESQSVAILTSLGIAEQEWRAQGIAPQTLVAIYHDFLQRKEELLAIAAHTARRLQHLPGVHAVRYRVKDPLHLLRKVIRKRMEYPDRQINEHNYVAWINDLAGVRALYLYKSDWNSLGRHIQASWDLKRPPIAYLTPNTDESTAQAFSAAGADIRWHGLGYRAVHYVVCTQPECQRYFVEIQLRTLFEEGWSEIDHTVRYPDRSCNALVRDLLHLLNLSTGQADQLASFIKTVLDKLQTHTTLSEEEQRQLQARIYRLAIPEGQKQLLHQHLEALQRRTQ